MFAFSKLDDVREIVHESGEKIEPDNEQMTHPQEVTAITYGDDERFDDIEESH